MAKVWLPGRVKSQAYPTCIEALTVPEVTASEAEGTEAAVAAAAKPKRKRRMVLGGRIDCHVCDLHKITMRVS